MFYPSKHSAWWRRLEDVFRLRLQKMSSRRLDQDEYIRLSHSSSEDVFKMSSRRLDQDQYIRLGHTSLDVFKTFWRCLQDVLQKRLQDIFKTSCQDLFKTSSKRLQDVSKNVFNTSSRRLQDVFKTSSRHLQDVLRGCFQDVLKTYHQVKLFA